MLGTVLIYAGGLVGLAGAVSVLRPLRWLRVRGRRRGAVLLGIGILLGLGGAVIPAPLQRVERSATRLDDILPAWQFAEHHEIRIHAGRERVDKAIRQVTASEIRFFRLLTWIRNPRRPWSRAPESILAPSSERPILDVALGSGFLLLADEPGRELVIGTLVVVPAAIRRLPAEELARLRASWSAARLIALDDPGYAKAAMNFRLADESGGWSRLSTETRVFATDDTARRRFAVYWRVIQPGSALIRRMWLQAIRRRAEGV